MLVEIVSVGDVICDSSQLGNGGMFFAEPELNVGKEVLSVDVSRTTLMLSNNFPSVLRRLIGLYELGSVPGLLGLGMGTTLALFQLVGKYSSRRRWLKRELRWVRVLHER